MCQVLLLLGAWSFVLHYPAGLGESFDFLKSSKLTTRLWSSVGSEHN
jgi:hypothetical protein